MRYDGAIRICGVMQVTRYSHKGEKAIAKLGKVICPAKTHKANLFMERAQSISLGK